MTARTADSEFTGTFAQECAFEDLSERRAVKLASMLRLTGRAHHALWTTHVGGAHFKERTGQFLPIYYLDFAVTDAPVPSRDPVQVDVRIRLGRHVDADGVVQRLVSESFLALWARDASGARIDLGTGHKQSIFTRPHSDPTRRRVTELHPALGLGALPAREIRPTTVDELLAPSPDQRPLGAPIDDDRAQAWAYAQSDPNQHVHAMEYLRVVETFAATELAHRGRDPGTYVVERARMLFRRPCFTGGWYRRRLVRHGAPDGVETIVATVHPAPDAASAADPSPATVLRLTLRPSPRDAGMKNPLRTSGQLR